jgi:putative FmdB family regulatory protein
VPTYQYACTECGHTFEQVQSFTDDALEHCPVCNGRVRKVFNAVGVVFKGSGFYRTDNRTKSSSTPSTTPSTPAAAPATSDAKPSTSPKASDS